MANNLKQSRYHDDEIDLREVLNTLMKSKILIIFSILIFTISAYLYSLSLKPSFKSSTTIEIGHYKMPNGTQQKIESPTSLIKGVKYNLKFKDQFNESFRNISMTALDEYIIRLETTSISGEKNEKLLSRFIIYLDEYNVKQEKLHMNDSLEPLLNEINIIEAESTFIKSTLQKELKFSISQLQNALLFINTEIKQLEEIILEKTNYLALFRLNDLKRERSMNTQETNDFKEKLKALKNDNFQLGRNSYHRLFTLSEKQKTLENELQYYSNRAIINTQIIGDIKTIPLKPRNKLIIFLGFFVGLFAGIVLVLIKNIVKKL
jgi:capsular polysaccharide biosynthesis protein